MKRILVVDDETSILETIQEILAAEGYSVELARNGAEALDRMGQTRPDMVLLEVMMPVLDGFGMLDRLRADPEKGKVPVVLMSAGHVPSERRQQVTQYLPKPFELEALLNAVSRALDGVAR